MLPNRVTVKILVDLTSVPCNSARSRPPFGGMSVLSAELKAILEANKVCATFSIWLADNGLADVEDLAVLATDEDKVQTKILDRCKDKVPEVSGVGDGVRITKAWRACRHALDKSDLAKMKPDVTDMETPLTDVQKRDLRDFWLKQHNFLICDGRMLIPTLVGRLYREINASPPQLPIFFLEQLRVASDLERKSQISLVIKPGQAAQGVETVVDSVTGSFEVFIRGRALVTTIAYCSIGKPSWFSYDDAEFFSEKLLRFVSQDWVGGRRPPLTFYIRAWVVTMQRFAEAVNVPNAKLGEVMRATSHWEHLWTMWSPPSEKAVEDHGMPDAVVHAASSDHEAEMNRLRKQASELQSARDRVAFLAIQPNKQQQQQPQGGKKNGNKGNNDNKNNQSKNNRKRGRGKGD